MQLITPDLVKNRSARREYSVGKEIENKPSFDEFRKQYESSMQGPRYQAPEPIVQQSYTGDVVPQGMIVSRPDEDYSPGANLKRNLKRNAEEFNKYVTQPTESFLYGIGKASGGGAIERAVTGDSPEQLAQKEAQAIKNMGNHSKIVNAGATVGSVTTPLGLNLVGVPAPVAFGEMAMLNKAAKTNDMADVAVAGAKAAAWAKLAGSIGAKNAEVLGKIPITQTSVPANFVKNFAANYLGAGSASYGLGSLEDLYNYARGREVDNAKTLANSYLNTSNAVYGAIQGYKGTVSDINASKAKLQQDIKNATENIEAYKRQAVKDTEHSTEAFKQKLAANRQDKINTEIGKLEGNKYLGGKNTAELEKAVEALRLGNAPQVELPKATLELPEYSGQVGNNLINGDSFRNQVNEIGLKHKEDTFIKDNLKNIAEKNKIIKVTDVSGKNDLVNSAKIITDITNYMNKIKEPIIIKENGKELIKTDSGIDDIARKGLSKDKKQALTKIKESVENSTYINSAPDAKKRPGISFDYYAAPIKTDDGLKIASIGDRIVPKDQDTLYNYYVKNRAMSPIAEIGGNPPTPLIQHDLTLNNSIPQNNQNVNSNSQNMEETPINNAKTEQEYVETNIGKIPVAEYRDIAAQQAGFDSYADMRKQGYKLGNKYDDEIAPVNTDASKSSFLMHEQDNSSSNTKIFEQTNQAIGKNTNKAVEEGAKALNLKPNENLSTYKKQQFQNNANAINTLIKEKNDTIQEINNKIAEKKATLEAKKDKTTKVAQSLKAQIANLEKRRSDTEARFINKIDRLENHNATINKLKNQVSEDKLPTRKEIREKIISDKDIEGINLDDAKDINKFIMNNTTPERVNEKVFGKETAQEINEKFFKPIKHNEAERTRFLNKERQDIESWGIKPKSRESEAMQMYGEGVYVNSSTGEETPYTLKDLQRSFPKDWQKIKNAAEQARVKYDNYIDTINKQLNKMGYDSIPKLKNYFRHFEETKTFLDTFGIPSKQNNLPTDLNGMTADLKPGKNFFSNALKRTGKKTTYDAITGIDGYLDGASKLIYHTDDIQNLRTLDEHIRNKYGSKADLEGLSKQEFNKRVEQIQQGHLSEYASWLTEYTNNLAGKKSRLDRGTEEAFGRRVYGTLNALKKQVGSNLTGLNVNSALSNFISAGQGLSSTSKYATAQGLIDTIKNIAQDDGFINKSDFLTTRFGSDKLSKTWWEKASNPGQIFMSGTDYFTANLITRSKYHEYLNKGYPEAEALQKADEYADRIMAGRGLGDMPNFFNSKTLGIITQFQLENVNQFDSMFHDNFTTDRAAEQTKYDAKTWNEKLKSKVAQENPKFYNGLTSTFVLAQLFAAGWAFNKIVKKLGGTGGAFDPIGTVEDFVKDYYKVGLKSAGKNLAKNIVDDIPYANFLTGGGRIPMKDSLPNIYDLATGESSLSKEATKLLNVIPPTGGGQIRKTIQGAKTLINNGEYGTRDGKEYLKWSLGLDDKNLLQRVGTSAQVLLFGKYGPSEAKEYIDNGYKGLTVTQTEAYKEAKETGMTDKEFRKWLDVLNEINPKKTDKNGKQVINSDAKKKQLKDALNKSDLTDEQKKIMYGIFYNVK